MKVLVTGGTGYIGSHTVCELLAVGNDVVIIDNLSNSKMGVLDKIERLTWKKVVFYEGDVADRKLLNQIFATEQFDAVIHFAGYKAVGESVQKPLLYYENNLESTLHLLEVMRKYDCKKLIFSSSATVYGTPKSLPIKEDFPLSTTNPYGTTKLMIEQILTDFGKANPDFGITILRYFNPIGSEKNGLLGEDPKGIPNNLMPYIVRVATGELEVLSVFGNDYDTIDGTGVRDYIHVVDLAKGHVKAFENLTSRNGIFIYNLGTGKGYSVLEIIQAFERVNGVKIPYKIVGRRAGDVAACYADASKAKEKLGWQAELTIDDMCRDSYRYILNQQKSKL